MKGTLTIDCGHTKGVKPEDTITLEEAERLYGEDFNEHIAALKEVKILLTENQKVALASFIYNNGVQAFKNSSICKKLNVGDIKGTADVFDKYIKANNSTTGKLEPSQGLTNRRKREKELFLTPDK